MPTKRVPMRKIREVLRLKFQAALSHEQIAKALALSKGVVSKYIRLAVAAGLSWPLPEELDDDARLEALLFPVKAKPERYTEPDYPVIHQQLKRKGVTLQLLWQEYCDQHPQSAYRYTQFCQRYRQWRGAQKRSMRQSHRAGEKLFIDYAGQTVPVVDPSTGECQFAQIFVAVMGASNYTFAEATWSQTLPDWIASHQRALRFFQGVPKLLVPDNLRAGVSIACRYDPQPNATYAEMAQHYGTAILPARPRKPKDKAKAEAGVQLVERWILARLRHQTFFSLHALNQAISQLLMDLNHRPFQKLPGSRASAFKQLDQPELGPVPAQPYEYAEWKKAKVGIDYHLQVDQRYYSVPHRLVGKVVEVRITANLVEVIHQNQCVARHAKRGQSRFSTVAEHMPKSHRAHQTWTPGRFMNWAQDIGPYTLELVKHQLENRPHPEHGYRACLGLLSQAKRYGKQRLEAACQRALALAAPRYASVTSILKQGLDQQPLESSHECDEDENTLPEHQNIRGPGYYH